ncbi:conserved hypothetical protein [Alteracholeplasma palmae J233]|uniref:Rod shape-determining protein MreD n=1 Tax=Alteracholeplasma palmae (strain ATCC 49389 / J233) TaxID=1318466 RepID=U4KR41_ALTPJ|nr:folate family ECF transporter S component [Alteracholeplasma palmae]CCV63846.1 conserved hypothetical protein [Alteracholeplasma palmae J233]
MKRNLRKITLTAVLTAASIILDVLVKAIIPGNQFGLPIFALPLIIISLFINPFYGLAAGLISDYIGFYLAPRGNYAIIFALSAAMWGFIPGIIANYKSKEYKIIISIFIAHLFATTANTFAMYIEISKNVALSGLLLRSILIPANVALLSILVIILNKRLIPVYDMFLEG